MQQFVSQQHFAQHRPLREELALDPFINRILLTGGTGFIGGAVLAELAATSLWPDTLIMVRANNLAEGKERVARSMQRFFPERSIANLISNDQIVLGSLEDAHNLYRDARTRHVTHVI